MYGPVLLEVVVVPVVAVVHRDAACVVAMEDLADVVAAAVVVVVGVYGDSVTLQMLGLEVRQAPSQVAEHHKVVVQYYFVVC